MIVASKKPVRESVKAFASALHEPETLFLTFAQALNISKSAKTNPGVWKPLENLFEDSVWEGALYLQAKLLASETSSAEAGESSSAYSPGYGSAPESLSAVFGVSLTSDEAMAFIVGGCAYHDRLASDRPGRVSLGWLVTQNLAEGEDLPEALMGLVKSSLSSHFKQFVNQKYSANFSEDKKTLYISFEAQVEVSEDR